MEMAYSDRNQLKQLLKEALAETLREERDFLHELMAEVLEDVAMTEAIRKGQETDIVPRDEVMALLSEDV